MSRRRPSLQIKLLPAALAAALVLLGSSAVASAQYYDQDSPSDQTAPQYQSAQQTDPSSRVARLAYSSGDVEFAPAGETDFGSADVNRPLTTGDRLLTGNDGRAALELGTASLRIDHGSAFNFLDLNDTTAQVELSQGTLNLRVRDLGNGQTYEIDTPTVAFVANQPGMYRVDVAPDGNGAMVTVFDGAGTVYGENGVSRAVDAGQSYRFNDSGLTNVDVAALPSPDDFDQFCQSRDTRYTRSVSRRYVSSDVIGSDDLDQYGDWQSSSDYGEVWYPTQVASGWAPYRDGHWAWVDPWGWTWVDNEPWGFAPFHYGRWAYVGNRWGWVPGPMRVRSVYAPALVAFVGGSGFSVSVNIGGGEPVGWFPLGPRDVYVPWYHASRNYFNDVNVTNIRNVYVNKTVINNYYGNYAANRPMPANYAYRNDARAFTAVPRNVFAGARPVREAVLHVQPAAFAKAQVMPPRIAPTQASLAIRPAARPIATATRAFDRTVVARHAPPPPPVPFAARERVIAQRGGAPIPIAQLHQMRQQQAARQPERVEVVAAAPHAAAPLPPMKRVPNLSPNAPGRPVAQTPVRAPEQAPGRYPPGQAHISPIQAPVHPANGAAPPPSRETALRPGELPSAHFAHPERAATPPPTAAERGEQVRAQQAQQRAQTEQQQAQLRGEQARQHTVQAQQAQQRAEQAHVQQQQAQQQAEQSRVQQQQAQQREAEASQRNDQMRAQQEQQRAEQARVQQEQQSRQAQMEQQRTQQARAQQEAQQREAQARQRDEQMHAQQAQQEQQRAEQARAQQEQQARQSQMMQQREEQMRAAQEQQRTAQEQQRAAQQAHAPQRPENAPASPQSHQPPPKKKDQDNQDNGH